MSIFPASRLGSIRAHADTPTPIAKRISLARAVFSRERNSRLGSSSPTSPSPTPVPRVRGDLAGRLPISADKGALYLKK
jgi:hypothetical protein